LNHLFGVTADSISTIALEAYQLANLHFVRLLEEGKALPLLNQTFFNRCCALVHGSTKKFNEELNATFEVYRTLRPQGWIVPDATNLSCAILSLARDMEIAAQNHIVMNTYNRLALYVRLRFALVDIPQAHAFIRGCFMDPETHLTDDQKEFKAWIEFDPRSEEEVEQNINHFIKKLAKVLEYFESLPEGTRYVKRFTLLPRKGDFIPQFFFIDKTTLPQLLNLLDKMKQQEIVRSMLELSSSRIRPSEFF
jgi:hypothetical protein